ncbi:unnamed protein product, partial [Rotaria sp. Silwood2]
NKSIVPFKNLSNLIHCSLIANPFQIGQTMKRGTLLSLPFNIEQMERVDLCKELNLWNKPLVNHPTGYVDEQPWLLLPPDNFYPISSIRLEAQQTVKRR